MKVPPVLRSAWRAVKYRAYGEGWLNRRSRGRFEARRTGLSAVQARTVDDLRREGFAMAQVGELLGGAGGAELWEAASAAGRRFVEGERVRRGIEHYRPGLSSGKEYLVRLQDSQAALGPDDPWLRIGLSQALLDTVNAYLGLWSKLNYLDVWYTIPSQAERQAVASQRWHRDPEDQRLVKIFLYLAEVDAGAGPLEYVRGSHAGGRYAGLWPNPDPGTASYPPEGEVDARIPTADRVTATGATGTLVFCDTHGLHRGGLATEQARVLATWAYVTPASIFARRFDVAWPRGSAGFGDAAEFAVR